MCVESKPEKDDKTTLRSRRQQQAPAGSPARTTRAPAGTQPARRPGKVNSLDYSFSMQCGVFIEFIWLRNVAARE